ncbi:hypothetical protein [Mycobacterium xenopi]|uniref:hypothetical protein n=1 Tax=Mycobacterium xenopi TaxID=1789 RepID=UPI000A163CF1|nr:hypothetical protein [Mycobacterium xenopi]ORX19449.1 hypothetical protein AWC32_10775 [Mycobacterium xenopi]SPX94813.1 Uncharacterised protein [Mycobacterium xenopi]
MSGTEWIVHPNRSELGPDRPGRNGHYRPLRDTQPCLPQERCQARITLPARYSRVADADGSVTFAGPSWWFVVGAARAFARNHIGGDVAPPFGFKDRGKWLWWDHTTSDESILDGPDATSHVREYLDRLFPGMSIALSATP